MTRRQDGEGRGALGRYTLFKLTAPSWNGMVSAVMNEVERLGTPL